jgi:hypothetical protein
MQTKKLRFDISEILTISKSLRIIALCKLVKRIIIETATNLSILLKLMDFVLNSNRFTMVAVNPKDKKLSIMPSPILTSLVYKIAIITFSNNGMAIGNIMKTICFII